MQFDMRIFIILGIFFMIFFAFMSSLARTEERIEHPPSSWLSVFNMILVMVFVLLYIFLLIVVLGRTV